MMKIKERTWQISEPSAGFYLVVCPSGNPAFCISAKTLFRLGLAFLRIRFREGRLRETIIVPGEQVNLEDVLNGREV